MSSLVAIPDADFFVRAQQSGDFHDLLASPGLRLRVIVPRPVYWELDELRFKADLGFTVREVRRRLEQLLREQQSHQALVTYETDLEIRTSHDQSIDEQLVSYLIQRARRNPLERIVLLANNDGVRNFALLSPAVQQLRNVHVSSMDDWPQAAEWLVTQSEEGTVQGWMLQVVPNAIEDVAGEHLQGIRVHVSCEIVDYSHGGVTMMIWFQDAERGAWLEDRNGKYQTGGFVTLSDEIFVYSDRDHYENTFFMPYDELHLAPGTYDLAIAANLIDPRSGRQVDESAWRELTHTERLPSMVLHGIALRGAQWVSESGDTQQGLEIICNFTVDSWRGRQGLAKALFRDQATGEYLTDENEAYGCDEGRVCVSDIFIAPFEHTRFRHYSLFIPYKELHSDRLKDLSALACQVTLWGVGYPQKLSESSWLEFSRETGPG